MIELLGRQYDSVNLVAVDVQYDFCPGGSLAVDEGDLVIPALNHAIEQIYKFRHQEDGLVVASRDWHPEVTSHFSNNPDLSTTWPVHCVAGTPGAEIHSFLNLSHAHIVNKGTKPDEDAYSAFDAVEDTGKTLEQLLGDPRKKKIAVMVGGLATDYCVKATVLDAQRLGYESYVLLDASRGVAPETTTQALGTMVEAGARLSTSALAAAWLS